MLKEHILEKEKATSGPVSHSLGICLGLCLGRWHCAGNHGDGAPRSRRQTTGDAVASRGQSFVGLQTGCALEDGAPGPEIELGVRSFGEQATFWKLLKNSSWWDPRARLGRGQRGPDATETSASLTGYTKAKMAFRDAPKWRQGEMRL